MRIKFLDGDPRAGQIAQMDSHRGQQLVDEGAAIQIGEDDVIVTVLKDFKKHLRGQTINVTRAEADKLEAEGLIGRNGLQETAGPPLTTAGKGASSASPAGRAARKTTSKKSDAGGKKAPAKEEE